MIKRFAKFEVSMFTHYVDIKGDENAKLGGLEELGVAHAKWAT